MKSKISNLKYGHPEVVHPSMLKKDEQGITKFNTGLALKITNGVGTMWTAYIFALISLLSLPAILVIVDAKFFGGVFPHWLIATALITLIAWISLNFIQLVLLQIIMVGQNVIQAQNDAKANVDHHTLTYLATLQDEQMTELKGITKILEILEKDENKSS